MCPESEATPSSAATAIGLGLENSVARFSLDLAHVNLILHAKNIATCKTTLRPDSSMAEIKSASMQRYEGKKHQRNLPIKSIEVIHR